MNNLPNVSCALLGASQEMEYGAVVPHVVGAARKSNFNDVVSEPLYALSKLFQAFLGHIDCSLRDIEDGDVPIGSGNQVIDERGFATADIDDGS
jgi:hypothetical protein